MNPYLEQKAGIQLANKLTTLKNTDLANPTFVLMKKSNRWLSEIFDQVVNNFYDQQIENEIMKIKLDSNIEKEIYLFNWIKVNGYDGLKKNYASTQDFLFKVNSPFYDRLNYYRYEFNKKNNNPNMLFRDFIGIWESILIKRINDYRFAKIEELRTKFMQALYNKVEIYNNASCLLKAVWNFFGKIWDPNELLKPGVDMAVIDKFAKFLEINPAIMEIATLLGRYQGESNLNWTTNIRRNCHGLWMKTSWFFTRGNYGSTESKDLEHIFPAELVLLKDPVLKYLFYKNILKEN